MRENRTVARGMTEIKTETQEWTNVNKRERTEEEC